MLRIAAVFIMVWCFPVPAQTQENPLTADLTVHGTAWNYGGILFDLEVTNISTEPITYYDPRDDVFVQFIDEEGTVYRSTFFNRLVGQPVLLQPGETHATQFEIESISKWDMIMNPGYGPVFGVGKYRVYDTLHYAMNGEDDISTFIASTEINVANIPENEIPVVDEYNVRYQSAMMRFFDEIHDITDHELVLKEDSAGRAKFREDLGWIGLHKDKTVHRRILQSAILHAVHHMNTRPEAVLREYLALYPDTPFAHTFARPLLTGDIPDWLIDKIKGRYLAGFADKVFARARQERSPE